MIEEPLGVFTDPSTEALLLKGAEEFNAGKFFECHETLEEAWRACRGPGRDFLQGLIQVSVGFYHLRNGNFVGGKSQLEKGLQKIERYDDSYAGMVCGELKNIVKSWLEKVRSGDMLQDGLPELPKFRFAGAKGVA